MRPARTIAGPVGRLTLVMCCIFAGNGMALPFLGRFLDAEHALSGLQIAAILSAAQLTRLFVGPLIAAWADGFHDRRTPLAFFACTSATIYLVFFFVDGFWALLGTFFLAQTLAMALTPLIEGAILRRAISDGGMSYGTARGIGSVAFIASNILGGVMVARFGVGVVGVWLIASMSAAALGALFALAPDPVAGDDAPSGFRQRLREALALFRKRAFAVPVIAAGLIQCAHSFYYGFSTLVWVGQGFSDAMIGWLWACGVTVEVALLWTLPRFERRFSPEALIAIGGAASVVRWSALALLPPALALWPLQALHALTFAAVHVGALRLVQREAPARVAGVAQTLYAAVASGTLAGLSMLMAGALYDRVGASGYLAMALLGAIGLVLMLALSPIRLIGDWRGERRERPLP